MDIRACVGEMTVEVLKFCGRHFIPLVSNIFLNLCETVCESLIEDVSESPDSSCSSNDNNDLLLLRLVLSTLYRTSIRYGEGTMT